MFKYKKSKGLTFNDPSLAKQSAYQETDIHFILNRYRRTGIMPEARAEGLYADYSGVPAYDEAMCIVARANEQFDGLPAAVRARFANDPRQLLAFVSDESNRDEAIKLGLIDTPVVSSVETEAPAVVSGDNS